MQLKLRQKIVVWRETWKHKETRVKGTLNNIFKVNKYQNNKCPKLHTPYIDKVQQQQNVPRNCLRPTIHKMQIEIETSIHPRKTLLII